MFFYEKAIGNEELANQSLPILWPDKRLAVVESQLGHLNALMAKYNHCPNCGNTDEGDDILRCTECNRNGKRARRTNPYPYPAGRRYLGENIFVGESRIH